MPLDANGRELRVGDRVRVLFNAGSLVEGESRNVRRVLALDGDERVLLEWAGGSQRWPADACRRVC